jgi:acyl dehydratase
MRKVLTIDEYKGMVGQELGVSGWLEIDQDRVNAFADVTEDHQFIHLDDARAKAETPFGGTIAHGFLTLSLLSRLNPEILPEIKDRVMTINYGLNKVRFLNPVRVGSRIRSRATAGPVTEKAPGQYLCEVTTVIEIEGTDKPALIAEGLLMYVIGG